MSAGRRPQNGMSVLLLDDDADFRSALAETLRYEGHRVAEFAAPGEVPDVRSLDGVEVVLADYHMPGQNGLQFADKFHAAHPEVPVILITSDPSRRIEMAVRARSYATLHRKPFTFAELQRLIEKTAGAA